MTPDAYVLVIPAPADWIVANGPRGNLYAHARKVREWRAKAAWAAKAARLPHIDGFVRITAYVNRSHAKGGRWDPANWHLTAKACVDGLVDAGVLTDDSTKFVDGPDMRPGVVTDTPRLTLVIRRTEPDRQENAS